MKKALFSVGLLLLATTVLPSCKKDYDCVCRLNGEEVGRFSLGKQSRADAKAACDAKATSTGVIWECSID